MTKVQISTNTDRKTVIVNEQTATPKELLVAENINLASATINLDGSILDVKKMNSTLAELGIQPDGICYLSAVTKATNAL